MALNIFISLTASITYGMLLFIVIRQGIRKGVKLALFLYLFSMAIWSLGYFLLNANFSDRLPQFLTTVMGTGILAMPISLFYFTQEFLGSKKRRYLLYIGVGLYMVLWFANSPGYFIKAIGVPDLILFREFRPEIAILGIVYWYFFIGLSIFELIRHYKRTEKESLRNRIRYPLLGAIILALGNIIYSFFSKDYPIDIIANLLNALLITYTIIRHDLLDLRFAARKSIAYTVLIVMLAITYFVPIVILEYYNYTITPTYRSFGIIFVLCIAIVMATLVGHLHSYFKNKLDRLLFREKYDAYRVIHELSRQMAMTLDLDRLVSMLLRALVNTMHISSVGLMLKDEQTGNFRLFAGKGIEEDVYNLILKPDHPVIQYLMQGNSTLTSKNQYNQNLGTQGKMLDRFDWELVIPLKVQDDLVGILILGKKQSEDMYSVDDKKLLTILAEQIAVTVKNASLFAEVDRSEAKYRNLTESLDELIYRADPKTGIITYINKEVEKIFGYKVDEWLKNPKLYNDLVYPDDREEVLSKRSSIQKNKSVGSIEYRITRKDNSIRWVEERISFEKDNQGNVNSVNGVIYDITERKLAAEQIKASLEEKEILLREIHHRVKNNLQIICSLLYLQSRNIINKEAIELFDDARNRIISMSLVHERLYQSHNLSKLPFSDYIKSLTSSLFRTYGVTPDLINLKLDLEDISLNIDKAIPCGLILNELITNSIKYGFKNGNGSKENKGEIAISFRSNGNNQINLIVSDNGSGIPENVDFRNTKSLGLQLVNRLVEQLDGNIDLDRNSGTKFHIEFAVK